MHIKKSYIVLIVLLFLVAVYWIFDAKKVKEEITLNVVQNEDNSSLVKAQTSFNNDEEQRLVQDKSQPASPNAQDKRLYRDYTPKVRNLLVQLTQPLSEEEKSTYQEQVDEANNFAYSDYNAYPVETLISLSDSGDPYASRALINRVPSKEVERYGIKSLDSGQLVSSAIALRLILDPETRPKAYAYLLLGAERGDLIARKSILVHLRNIPTTEKELVMALDYMKEIEKSLSR